MAEDGALPGSDQGVPFMMTRPKFTAEKDANGDYEVALSYVPDPSQRYSLRINPSLLANVGFKATYGDRGELSGLTGSVTDQLAPTIVSLLKMASGIAGGIAAETAQYAAPSGYGCSGAPTNWGLLVCALNKAPENPLSTKAPCDAEAASALRSLASVHQDAEAKDRGDVYASIYANSPSQTDCLDAAAKIIGDDLAADAATLTKGVTDAFNASIGSAASTKSKAAFDILLNAIKELDAESIRRMAAALEEYGDPNSPTPQDNKGYVYREFKIVPDSEEGKIVTALRAALAASPTADKIIERMKVATGAPKKLRAAAFLTPEQWAQRRVADLDRQEGDAVRSALMANPSKDPATDSVVKGLREQKVAAIGATREYVRLLNINDELDKLPKSGSNDRQSRSEEYLALRDESIRLSNMISERLTIVRGVKAKATSDEPAAEAPWVAESCLVRAKERNWFHTAGVGAPEFIVVLKRPGAAGRESAALSPTPGGECVLHNPLTATVGAAK